MAGTNKFKIFRRSRHFEHHITFYSYGIKEMLEKYICYRTWAVICTKTNSEKIIIHRRQITL
jgi:hypothetical protein